MKDQTKVMRKQLTAISNEVRPLVNDGQFNTVNEAILNHYREDTGASRFDSFNQWKEKGFHVIKGETAFLVWGSPRTAPVADSGDDYKYFPLCFLFSDLQVQAN